jgi:hypothetical protein
MSVLRGTGQYLKFSSKITPHKENEVYTQCGRLLLQHLQTRVTLIKDEIYID